MIEYSTKKLVTFLVSIILIILLGVALPFFHKGDSPKWNGISEDGKWKAVIAKGDNTDDYFGRVYWKGDKAKIKDIYLTFLQLKRDDQYATGDTQERTDKMYETISNPEPSGSNEFIGYEPYDGLTNKKLEVFIHWKQNNQKHETKVLLKKKDN